MSLLNISTTELDPIALEACYNEIVKHIVEGSVITNVLSILGLHILYNVFTLNIS